MKYADFEAAKNGELLNFIPSKFTLPDPQTGKSAQIQSCVHEEDIKVPQSYCFEFADRLIRLVDTPGFDGSDNDKGIFNSIFNYLSSLEEVHAILVLVKSTMSPITFAFRLLLTELFSRLHRNALPNVFCYTFSRSAFFSPADGFASVQEFLATEMQEVDFNLVQNSNCLFIDNEFYRYLVASKQGFVFSNEQCSIFKDAFEKSSEQALEMLLNIFDFVPHAFTESLKVNNTQKIVHELLDLIFELQMEIKLNKEKIEDNENCFQI